MMTNAVSTENADSERIKDDQEKIEESKRQGLRWLSNYAHKELIQAESSLRIASDHVEASLPQHVRSLDIIKKSLKEVESRLCRLTVAIERDLTGGVS